MFYSSWKDSLCGSQQHHNNGFVQACSAVFSTLALQRKFWVLEIWNEEDPCQGFFLAVRKLHRYQSWTLLYLLIRRLFSTVYEALPQESSFTPKFSAQKEKFGSPIFKRWQNLSCTYPQHESIGHYSRHTSHHSPEHLLPPAWRPPIFRLGFINLEWGTFDFSRGTHRE